MKVTCERIGCGKEFEKTVPWKRFCGSDCKWIAWALKKINSENQKRKGK